MAESQALNNPEKLREQAQEMLERADAIDGIENTVLLLSHIVSQVQELVQIMDAPKIVERDEKGKPIGIRLGV